MTSFYYLHNKLLYHALSLKDIYFFRCFTLKYTFLETLPFTDVND